MKIKKWVHMTFSLPIEVGDLLRRESEKSDRKLSIIVTRALVEHIKK